MLFCRRELCTSNKASCPSKKCTATNGTVHKRLKVNKVLSSRVFRATSSVIGLMPEVHPIPRTQAFSSSLCETILSSFPSSQRPMAKGEELSSVSVFLTEGVSGATLLSVGLSFKRPVVLRDLLEPPFDSTFDSVHVLYWAMAFWLLVYLD